MLTTEPGVVVDCTGVPCLFLPEAVWWLSHALPSDIQLQEADGGCDA